MNGLFLDTPLIAGLLLLLVRVIVAISFFFSALGKARDLKKSAKQNGLPVGFMGFIMVAEFAGAAGMITGLLGQFAAIGLMLLMLGTMSLHIFKWHSKYWAESGGWEYDLMLFTLSGVIAVFGTGIFALAA